MSKKGDISMNYIVIALLALVVLVVIVLFFTGGMQKIFGQTAEVGEITEQQLSLWKSQCRLSCSLKQKGVNEGFCKAFERKDENGNVIDRYVCNTDQAYGCEQVAGAKSLEIVCEELKIKK